MPVKLTGKVKLFELIAIKNLNFQSLIEFVVEFNFSLVIQNPDFLICMCNDGKKSLKYEE